jgi:site-specific DNA-methyltransferase (adenine-specific)
MTAIEDAGAEIRDCLMWLYGQGFPKSQDIGKRVAKKHGDEVEANNEWSGWGNALKPAYEPIIMARKPFKGSLVNNVLEHGTGGINIDATRVGSELMPAKEVSTQVTQIGWKKKGYTSPEKTGRHPANVMLTHSPGCRQVGETTETIIGGNKGKSGFAEGYESGDFTKKESPVELYECEDGCPIKELDQQAPHTGGGTQTYEGPGPKLDGYGGASRFFYKAKVGKKERNAIVPNHHPTVKPIDLMKWLVKLVSVEGQTIFDPFAGSGSTGIACVLLNREFIGTEMDPDYAEIARKRIDGYKDKEE